MKDKYRKQALAGLKSSGCLLGGSFTDRDIARWIGIGAEPDRSNLNDLKVFEIISYHNLISDAVGYLLDTLERNGYEILVNNDRYTVLPSERGLQSITYA